ncbi:MAG: GTP 3',8-cyclase MoaA [Desulfomonilaceae bacterium]|nr:GTP 3',8-cyclase MoaA [Desulfomonilaceae bacterium]
MFTENADSYNRRIDYLRISITDRCNLRCCYCMPAGGVYPVKHREILRYEEILRIVRVFAGMGLTKVRLTGGEPLLRKHVCGLVERIVKQEGIRDVGITTNGVLLKEMAQPLYDAGLRRINVSLDTLNPLKFRMITGTDHHREVLAGISEAERVGFDPIKVNVVLLKNINSDDLLRFAQLSRNTRYQVRFIEWMPIGRCRGEDGSRFFSAQDAKKLLESTGRLIPIPRSRYDGPAERYRFDSAAGEVGLIGSVSNHFCRECNRMRLTADGKLRPCLLSDEEVDVRSALRANCSDHCLSRLIQTAIALKPAKHGLDFRSDHVCRRDMSQIGG